MLNDMLEGDLLKHIKAYLKYQQCWFMKVHGGGYSVNGVPDIIICFRGRFIALELKTDTGVVSKLQTRTMKDIRQKGDGVAYAVRSVDDVKQIFREVSIDISQQYKKV